MKHAGPLEKAFAALEFLAEAPERWRPLAEIAAALGLHRATGAHVLRKLVDLHYVEQEGPRGGYRLGPRAYYLVRRGPYRRDLIAAAEPHMTRLARAAGETVVLVALRHGRRITLLRIAGRGAVRVDEALGMDDNTLRTPTGRLLLSHAPPHEVDAVLAETGRPGDAWPAAADRERLDAALATLRARAEPLALVSGDIAGIATPIREAGRVTAALGLFLPAFRFRGRRRRTFLQQLAETARDISNALNRDERTTT